MRALVITGAGGPEVLRLVDRPPPEPAAGEIRVRVFASGLNRADILQRRGRYPAPASVPPDVPGLEYAGEVEALGEGATLWRPGERVMGIVGGGAHAEYLVVDERQALPIPTSLGWEAAAAIPEAFLTAFDALFRRTSLREGERLLIHAVGSGVGTAALQLAIEAGAVVFGSSRRPAKLENAAALGLHHAIDSSDDEWPRTLEALTGGEGLDVVLDLVGGAGLSHGLRLLRDRGRLVVVGLVAGTRAELDLAVLLRNRLSVFGTVLRSRARHEKVALAADFASSVLPALAAGRVHAVIDSTFGFEAAAEAHRRLESDETFGKVVLHW